MQRFGRQMGGGPRVLGDPAALAFQIPCGRAHAVHQVGAVVGIILNAGIDPLEPFVPPAQGFLKKADARFGGGEMGVFMDPWADDALGPRQGLHQLRHGVLIGVAPAANGQHLGLDRAIILTHRAVLPIGIAALMAQPECWQKRFRLKPLQPHLTPIGAQGRVGGARGIGPHGRPPAKVFIQQAAALVMDVIGKAVHGGA